MGVGSFDFDAFTKSISSGDLQSAFEMIMADENAEILNRHELLKQLGNAFLDRGILDGAEALYRKALEVKADYADAVYNLGIVFNAKGMVDAAKSAYLRAFELDPKSHEAATNLGIILTHEGAHEDALHCFDTALQVSPGAIEPITNRGVLLVNMGKFGEANTIFDSVLNFEPNLARVHVNRSQLKLLQGDFKGGFSEYEWRLELPEYTLPEGALQGEEWDGEPLKGNLLIYPEQGAGTQIQFLRFLKQVRERVDGAIILGCFSPLRPLYDSLDGVDQVIALDQQMPEGYDCYISVASLPYLFCSNETLQTPTKFNIEAKAVAKPKQKKRLKVGLCWRGQASHPRDLERSIALEAFKDLIAENDDCAFYSFQIPPRADEIAALGLGDTLIDLSAQLSDFAETAALVQSMDLVISVDTAMAHLAASLGIDTKVLVTYAPDWRWGLDSPRSLWYPTVTLYRQKKLGDWAGIIAELSKDLKNDR